MVDDLVRADDAASRRRIRLRDSSYRPSDRVSRTFWNFGGTLFDLRKRGAGCRVPLGLEGPGGRIGGR